MRIFITGATGYIGFAVAQALRRAGHEVWGLVRSEQKAAELARHEILSVIGSMQKPDSYLSVAAECSVLVHAAVDYTSGELADLDRTTLETLILAGNRGPVTKRLIYTSGVWVYGNTGTRPAEETTPLSPPKYIQWRPNNEQRVLNASSVRGLVLRPGCVYGKQGGLPAYWFAASKDKPLRVVGDGNNRWTMIHVDDVADGYVRAVESDRSGEIFNLTDRSRFTVREMALACGRAAGYDGEIQSVPLAEALQSMGQYAECLTLDQHVDSRRAVRLLGWQPKHGGLIDGIDSYYASWKASL